MLGKLRLEVNRWLEIEVHRLNPLIGCGLVLSKIPRFYPSEAFQQIFYGYHIKKLYADKECQKLLNTEKIVDVFCHNALKGIPLGENFRTVFYNYRAILLIDKAVKNCWFLGESENRLPFINYYREIVPKILKEHQIILSGAFHQLLPIGWQNLYDVFDEKFIKLHSEIKGLEVLSTITDTRYRNYVLGVGINLLNLSAPETIKKKIIEALEASKL
jgi:hypothetical protein